jgi:hypothetical protein
MKKTPRSKNLRLMVILWVFAISLTALVLILMNMRGSYQVP